MRMISKVLTGSAVAAAALTLAACGSKTDTNVDNTTVTELNGADDMGTMTDNMTTVDGAATNVDAGLANDTAANATAEPAAANASNAM